MKIHIPWRPMETAPKDGTEILVIDNEKDVTLVSWIKDEDVTGKGPFRWCAVHSYQDEQGGFHTVYPTGWLPLPDEKGFEVPESEPIKDLSEFKQQLWEWHSQPAPEGSRLEGENIMTEDSFFEVLAEFQKKIGNVLETFPPEVLPIKRIEDFSVEVIAIWGVRTQVFHYDFVNETWRDASGQLIYEGKEFRWYYPPVKWEEVKDGN